VHQHRNLIKTYSSLPAANIEIIQMLLLQLNRNFLDSHIRHGFTMLNTWGSNLKYSGLIKLNKGTERDVMEV